MGYEEVEGRLRERWREELKQPKLKGKIGFEDSLRMLITKCMLCSPEEFDFAAHTLYWAIPESWTDDEFITEAADAVSIVSVEIPFYNAMVYCPILSRQEMRQQINWRQIFHAILNLCHRRNLLIPTEQVEHIVEGVKQE
jgi:hypothetical protein